MEGVKVVGIGGGVGRGNVGGICYVEVEEDWGDNRALGTPVWTILGEALVF